ncbi:protein kinase-like domain-containing protein [Artemisia annua]|uniref:non-specific serine/threonine protein kinase n=1 Tax=Artemisia annua TaxID=35608 RepID=A0A2U1L347_ARTAN|nr:protein kinase-like domain-containing protein [Artemisia annua]
MFASAYDAEVRKIFWDFGHSTARIATPYERKRLLKWAHSSRRIAAPDGCSCWIAMLSMLPRDTRIGEYPIHCLRMRKDEENQNLLGEFFPKRLKAANQLWDQHSVADDDAFGDCIIDDDSYKTELTGGVSQHSSFSVKDNVNVKEKQTVAETEVNCYVPSNVLLQRQPSRASWTCGVNLLLKTLRNENLIVLYGFWRNTENNHLNFITEACVSGNLRDYRKKHKCVSLKVLKKCSRQILKGLNYLHTHEPCVIHRDLNYSNFFNIGNTGKVKIGDFSLASAVEKSHMPHSLIATPEYMVPELYEENYNESGVFPTSMNFANNWSLLESKYFIFVRNFLDGLCLAYRPEEATEFAKGAKAIDEF